MSHSIQRDASKVPTSSSLPSSLLNCMMGLLGGILEIFFIIGKMKRDEEINPHTLKMLKSVQVLSPQENKGA